MQQSEVRIRLRSASPPRWRRSFLHDFKFQAGHRQFSLRAAFSERMKGEPALR